MSSIAERIAQLTPQQRKLIALRRQKQAEAKQAEQAIVPLEGEGPWPASVDQTALWFIHKLNPEGKGYNISSCARLRGPFEDDVLQASFDHIVRRHEILRTSFTEIEGKPYQVVHDHMETPITFKDVSHLPREKREAAARAEISDFVTPFNHETGPLVRMQVIRLDAEDHVVQAMFDHTAIDWWSFQIFFNELWVGYVSEMEGEAPELPPMPIQFRDYASWRNNWLESEQYQKSIAFWKESLKDAPTLLDMPTDRPRPASPNYRGALQRFSIPLETMERLRGIASKVNCSSLMSLLSVTFAFIGRYCNTKDLLIGTTITNRDREETHLMMGYLLNILVMRGQLHENPSFIELMEQVRGTVLGAFDHKEVPFRKLVEELNPERDLSRMPIYQVEFIYVTTGGPTIAHQKSSEVAAIPTPFNHTNFEYDRETSAIDLQIAFSESPTGTDLLLEYMTDLFQAETVRRMGHLLLKLLDGMIENPNMPIMDIPWLTDEDRVELVSTGNQTNTQWNAAPNTLQLIAQQATQTPNQKAVIASDQTLSYQQLMSQATQIANGLLAEGVSPESRVGVMLERHQNLLPTLLGVWLAGAAYVPLDPAHPEARLRYIAEDAGVSLVITNATATVDLKAKLCPVETLLTSNAPSKTFPVLHPEQAAYLIYTSGSTGKPKGVTIAHGALFNFLQSMSQQPGMNSQQTMLAVTTLAFDIAGLELYLPLIHGATVVLADSTTSGDGRLLAGLIETHRVDVMQATPATYRLLFESGWQGRRSMHVFCGGEALPEDLAQQLVAQCGDVWNLYGPTETTIWSTRTKVRRNEAVHLGKPIENTEVFVVNQACELTPAGVPGELLIGGHGVARGYWGKPSLTACQFIPNPFSNQPGSRLYRTGDLVKYRNDGNLLFLGRIDFQVKVRGYRIELDEIANVLLQHQQVAQTVVTAFESAAGSQLAAYYSGQQTDSDQLRHFLSQRLPGYMVPSFFIYLEALPLNANGKINRRGLPKPDASAQRALYVAPRNDLEESLVTIWQDILATDKIGIHDSFFLLGGHSLLATQVAARMRSRIGRDLPLKKFFDQPTIAELSSYLQAAEQHDTMPAMKWVARGQDYPLSYSQERMWFLTQLDHKSAFYNMPVPLSLTGELDVTVLKQVLEELLHRHEIFRTRFVEEDEGPVQRLVAHQELPFTSTVLDLAAQDNWEDTLHNHLTQVATVPFDLVKGPLIRFHHIQTGPQRHHLLMLMHHIISDGWSVGILFREFASLYRAFSQQKASPLNELRLQYLDYAVWQRRHFEGARLEKSLAYWKETLDDAPGSIGLPYDYPRPKVQTFNGDVVDIWLDHSHLEALETVSRRYGATPFMTLLATYGVLLYHYCGQFDFCVGTPVANRGEAETEAMVGLFINTLVLRLNLASQPSFEELLSRVRNMTLEAFDHQDAPFEKVVEALVPERNPSMTPLFQTFFSLETLGLEDTADQALGDLNMAVMDIEVNQAKFDLSMNTFISGNRLRLNLEFNTDLFYKSTVEQMGGHFGTILKQLAQNPEQLIHKVNFMTEAQVGQVTHEWNQTRTDYPRDSSIHAEFEVQVRKTPNAVALILADETMSYDELNRLSNRYARKFMALGIGYQDMLGVAVRTSFETVAMVLGALKVGAAYMPIDVEYPAERIQWMLQDSKAKLLVTEAEFGIKTTIDTIEPERPGPEFSDENLNLPSHPLQAAQLFYTSGSTGKPKGALVQHRSVLRLSLNTNYARFDETQVMIHMGAMAFDASTFEMFGCLLNGGKLLLHAKDALGHLPTTLRKNKVTIGLVTPQLFNMLLDEEPEAFETMEQVLSGGEALSRPHVKRFMEDFPHIRMINAYGPTETTSLATCCDLNKVGLSPIAPPIGTAISNSTAYILDKYLQPVPVGVFGELCLGGDGVTNGYFHRPGRSSSTYVPDPFAPADRPGSRLYKTGDRVRWLRNGVLEFGSRFDRQVKMRGLRMELGEIETALVKIDKIQSAAVIYDPAEEWLVAYLVGPNMDDLPYIREILTAKLPIFMIPSAWAFLPKLPITRNGKLNTKALAKIPVSTQRQAEFRPPETETQTAVMEVWGTLLKCERIGLDDNFFELGGHSLLATRALTRLRHRFKVEIPIQAIFQYPILEDFARFLDIGIMSLDHDLDSQDDMEEGAI